MGQELFINNITALEYSAFDKRLPTVFIIHGWSHGKDIPWLIEMRTGMPAFFQNQLKCCSNTNSNRNKLRSSLCMKVT